MSKKFLFKVFLKLKLYSLGLLIFMSSVQAVTIQGFYLDFPNRFWPNRPFFDLIVASDGATYYGNTLTVIGSQVQRNSSSDNPDVFCESQRRDYRLPGAGDINLGYSGLAPASPLFKIAPAHWSGYENNDVSSQIRKEQYGRIVGGLANEWGLLNAYSIWPKSSRFWLTEPYVNTGTSAVKPKPGSDYTVYYKTFTNGRYFFNTDYNTPADTMPAAPSYQSTSAPMNVACVRDLVPTPSTPSPGRT